MLNRTNIIGFVSGGKRPFASDNTALIWDDETRCLITEIIVGSIIHNFFLSYTKLVTVEKTYISIFSYPNKLEKLREEKIQGLSSNVIAVCPDQKSEIMVYPGLIVGTISILNLLKTEKNSATVPLIVSAHKHPLVAVALNKDGTLVSTGSTMGTLVKVFSTRSGDQVAELRRGLDNVILRCLCFSLCGNYVLASSNKETAHIFCLESKPHDNQKSIKDLVPLINKNEKRSVLKVELPPGQGDAECAFVPSSVPHASHKLGKPNTCPYDILSISKQGCLSRFSGCAVPQCFGSERGGRGYMHDSKFNAGPDGDDGFFRDNDFNKVKSRFQDAPAQTARCESGFNSQSCSQGNSWVGGFNIKRDGSIAIQCCTYDGMRFSEEVGKPVVHIGEVYSGGEVVRDGRQTGFDIISNIRKVSGGYENAVYELTVHRVNCLPDPVEETNDVQLDGPQEISRILEKVTDYQKDPVPAKIEASPGSSYAAPPAQDTYAQVGQASYAVPSAGYYYPVSGSVPACFAPNTIVITSNGESRIDELKLGDFVLTDEHGVSSLSEVTAFLHKLPDTEVSFIHIELEDGTELDITPQHFIYQSDCKSVGFDSVYAETLEVGKCLNKLNDQNDFELIKIKALSVTKIVGAYSPLTKNGNIIVNGISASCHSVVKSNSLAHSFFYYLSQMNNKMVSIINYLTFQQTTSNASTETVELPAVATYFYDALNLIIPENLFDGHTRDMFMTKTEMKRHCLGVLALFICIHFSIGKVVQYEDKECAFESADSGTVFFGLENTAVSPKYESSITGVSLEECKDLCLHSTEYKGRKATCGSFTFRESIQKCLIVYDIVADADSNKGEDNLNFEEGVKFYEKSCINYLPEACNNRVIQLIPNRALAGYTENVTNAANIENCFENCLKYNSICKSFMFFPHQNECLINSGSAAEFPNAMNDEDTDGVLYGNNECHNMVFSKMATPVLTQVSVHNKEIGFTEKTKPPVKTISTVNLETSTTTITTTTEQPIKYTNPPIEDQFSSFNAKVIKPPKETVKLTPEKKKTDLSMLHILSSLSTTESGQKSSTPNILPSSSIYDIIQTYFGEWETWGKCQTEGERLIRRRKCLDLQKCRGKLNQMKICKESDIPPKTPDNSETVSEPVGPFRSLTPVSVLGSRELVNGVGLPPSIFPNAVPVNQRAVLPDGAPAHPDYIWSPWASLCQRFATTQPCADGVEVGFESRECIAKDPKQCKGPFFRYCTLKC
uniref:HintN domain-containing protein n=1 Tax=Rhabditophanes sp. KR3021 TaxID=114890 RepID=A0AC35U3J8_9BILA